MMTIARRKPCFDSIGFYDIHNDFDLGECQLSRYWTGSDVDCALLRRDGKPTGHTWERCEHGRLSPLYREWRRRYEDTVECTRCHGTGRVRR
jgi:hypothetical protein